MASDHNMIGTSTHPLWLWVALVLLGSSAPAHAAPSWKWITREDGIAVAMRDVPGRDFPTFRGVGVVGASIYDVLAVLSDTKRQPEWMDRCIDARLLRKISEKEYIVYSRTDVPWPIADRDAVYHSKVHVNRKRNMVNIRFRAVRSKLKGKVKGVVRMTSLRGHFKLSARSLNSTLVDYQVDADPAGSIPRWLAKIATRRLPLQTIRKLRKQVKKTRGWYTKRIQRWKAMKE